MEFIKILKGHFWTHGIPHPIRYLAEILNVNDETIRVYCRQANFGVGDLHHQLSPKTASWLIEQSIEVMDEGESRNPVQEFLRPKTEGEE